MNKETKPIPGLFGLTQALIWLTSHKACSSEFAKKTIQILIEEPTLDWEEYICSVIKKQDNVEEIANEIVKDNFTELDRDYNNSKLNVERKLTSILSNNLNDYQPFPEYGVQILIAYGKLI